MRHIREESSLRAVELLQLICLYLELRVLFCEQGFALTELTRPFVHAFLQLFRNSLESRNAESKPRPDNDRNSEKNEKLERSCLDETRSDLERDRCRAGPHVSAVGCDYLECVIPGRDTRVRRTSPGISIDPVVIVWRQAIPEPDILWSEKAQGSEFDSKVSLRRANLNRITIRPEWRAAGYYLLDDDVRLNRAAADFARIDHREAILRCKPQSSVARACCCRLTSSICFAITEAMPFGVSGRPNTVDFSIREIAELFLQNPENSAIRAHAYASELVVDDRVNSVVE